MLDILFAAELKNLPDNLNNSTVVQLGLRNKVPFVHPEELANFDQLLTSRSGIYIPNATQGAPGLLGAAATLYTLGLI